MAEVLFYHLTRRPLERELPVLLEKSLERGWRAVVQAGGSERVGALDDLLWTYGDSSFLPHGTARDGDAERQPVWLTAGVENPNGARVRVFVDGAMPTSLDAAELSAYERIVMMFDGNDEEQLLGARAEWRRLKETGMDLVYWQQGETGWEKKA